VKRLHIQVSVDNLADSIRLYSGMFACEPPRHSSRVVRRSKQNAAASTSLQDEFRHQRVSQRRWGSLPHLARSPCDGAGAEKRETFNKVFKQIMDKMLGFISLPAHILGKRAIQQEIKKIGATPV